MTSPDITYEEFTRVRDAIVGCLDDKASSQWFSNSRYIASKLLVQAEEILFSHHLVEKKERELLADLIKKYGVPK